VLPLACNEHMNTTADHPARTVPPGLDGTDPRAPAITTMTRHRHLSGPAPARYLDVTAEVTCVRS
jgi:hypothetical protein